MNFFDADCWKYTSVLKHQCQTLYNEFRQFNESDWVINNQKYIGTQGGWYFIPFIGKGVSYDQYLNRCPTVQNLLKQVPIFDNCVFSIMGPQSEIKPHRGHSDDHLRVHLTLITDGNAYIKVGDDVKWWQEREVLIFQDYEEHSTKNPSDSTRVVFLFDIKREDYFNNLIG
jgi:aspartyl/asparaginyl beta-hydroxylase (cupin superfamily)